MPAPLVPIDHPSSAAVAAEDPAVVAARARTTEALLRAAAVLDQVAVAHARAGRAVREAWLGPHRARFDAERARRDAELAGLAAACRRLAGR
ncbi:MAG: hypothetical protein R2746_12630 [Acidimicrobiales bacterium]